MSATEIITERGDLIMVPGGAVAAIPENCELAVGRDPKEVIEEARKAAKVLMAVVRGKSNPIMIRGELYLEFEDWQTIGRFYNLTTRITSVEYVDYGGVVGFSAYAEIVNVLTGRTLGGAEASCLRDEAKWKNEPLFQLKSMAETRAQCKAFSSCLRWVVVLEGFKGTPAEELDGVARTERTEQAPAATQGADNGVGSVWTDAKGDWHIHCAEHGASYGKEWDKGDSVKCNRKVGDGWCKYQVAKPKPAAATADEFDALKGKELIAAFTDDAEEAGYQFGGSKAKMAAWASLLLDEKVETVSQGHMRRVLRQPKGGKMAAAGHLNRESDKPEPDAVREARGDGQESVHEPFSASDPAEVTDDPFADDMENPRQ